MVNSLFHLVIGLLIALALGFKGKSDYIEKINVIGAVPDASAYVEIAENSTAQPFLRKSIILFTAFRKKMVR